MFSKKDEGGIVQFLALLSIVLGNALRFAVPPAIYEDEWLEVFAQGAENAGRYEAWRAEAGPGLE